MKPSRRRHAFTLIELLVVVGLLALLISLLLPALSHARKKAQQAKLEVRSMELPDKSAAPGAGERGPAIPRAALRSFVATIALTPRLSVGTAEPESIYEASFQAVVSAERAAPGDAESEIELPLPPQIISLGDLTVTVNGAGSEAVSMRDDKLVWHGQLPPDAPAKFDVTYTAVGKGLYTLQPPPGRILDQFKIELAARGSGVQMLELSMQPTSLSHSGDLTSYVWDYQRLMFGRPIALDVLGIAPVDRLGELRWLGPLSVVAFGIVLGLVSRAYNVANVDRWMLLLILGLFSGAYPLMYFAQEFIPLRVATLGIGAIVLLGITIRAIGLMGFRLAILGVLAPAALLMALTLVATTHGNLQGILLTSLALGLFALGMMLAPRLQLPMTPPQPTPAV